MKTRPLWPLLPPVAALGIVFFFLTLTHWLGSFGIQCGVKELTGLHCPGCGGTRSALALSRGDISQAWNHNALLTLGAFLFLAGSLYLIVRVTLLGKEPPRLPKISNRWVWSGLIALLLFTILRNTTTFAWLAP